MRHFEIWNEPNLQLFYRPQYKGKGIKNPVAAKNYSNLVKAAYPRIKSVNPRAVVIAGVTGPKSSNDSSGQGTLSWLKSLAKFKPKMDAYSQHIYPAVAPDADTKAVPSWNSIDTLLAQVDKIKRGLPMYITEAGYTTGTTKFRKVKVTLSVQKTNLKEIFGLKVGQAEARAGRRVVQPPGQQVLARRAAQGQRGQEAVLRRLPGHRPQQRPDLEPQAAVGLRRAGAASPG